MTNDELFIKAKWSNPNKYKRKMMVVNHGISYFTITHDKSHEDILNEMRKDYNLDKLNNPMKKMNIIEKMHSIIKNLSKRK